MTYVTIDSAGRAAREAMAAGKRMDYLAETSNWQAAMTEYQAATLDNAARDPQNQDLISLIREAPEKGEPILLATLVKALFAGQLSETAKTVAAESVQRLADEVLKDKEAISRAPTASDAMLSALAETVRLEVSAAMQAVFRGPALDDYDGYLCARSSKLSQIPLFMGWSARNSIAPSIEIWLQNGPSSAADGCARVQLLGGRKAKIVHFDIVLIGVGVDVTPEQHVIVAPVHTTSTPVRFVLSKATKQIDHAYVLVQVFQKNRLIQSLKVAVTGDLL